VGLVITIIGFALALWRIRKSQTAAEQARNIAESVRDQILQMNAVQELHTAIRNLEDLRRLHRSKAWSSLPDRYTSLRMELIAIRGRTPTLTTEQRSSIQSAIQQLSNLEDEIENAIAENRDPAPRLIITVSKQIDRLAILLVELQNQIDRLRQ
jgi:hypothetical protein